MKVILNEDVKHLGELGDVKNVANGYARNYLFPHSYALPYTDETVAFFEGRKAEIEARKQQKRADSKSLKEKLEALAIELDVPAGVNGKLYGSVNSQTIMDWFSKNGFEIERKRIEIPGLNIKSTGHYTFKVHLYEAEVAEVKLSVVGQVSEEDKKKAETAAKAAAKAAKAEEKADAPEASEEEDK